MEEMRCSEVREETVVAKMKTTKPDRGVASKVKNNFFNNFLREKGLTGH